tara:strand:- start:1838 stop:2146 length:309 start_codon:yes stop_codon:yes gene_type:complete
LFTIGDGIVCHLARVTIDIRENFTFQNLSVLICLLAKVISVDIILLFFNPYCFSISFFDPHNTVIVGIDAVIVIRGLLVRTARSHKKGTNHQYGRGSQCVME